MTDKFSKFTTLEKIYFFVVIALSLLVITFSILSLFDVITFKFSSYFIYPSMTVGITLNGIRALKQNKAVAFFSFACSAFIMIVSIIIFTDYIR